MKSRARLLLQLTAIACTLASTMAITACALAETTLDSPVETLDQWLDQARRTGRQDMAELARINVALEQQLAELSGIDRIAVQIELARVHRQRGALPTAAQMFEESARAAAAGGRSNLAFDAWIGAARSHSDRNDVEAAGLALDEATRTAGAQPTAKQAYALASFGAMIMSQRGDSEAALVASLEATQLATTKEDSLFAQLDTGDAFWKLQDRCDERPLVDSRSIDDTDRWGACRRAILAARNSFTSAEQAANVLGWKPVAAQARMMARNSGFRSQMIDQKAKFENKALLDRFDLRDDQKPLVNNGFRAEGGSPDQQRTAELVKSLFPGRTSDPRQLYIQGQAAEMAGDNTAALQRYRQATEALKTERSGYFDARRRGTVTEGRATAFRDLALLQLQLGQYVLAFDTFESVRSRGLGELVATMDQAGISARDRDWLRRIALVEARLSGAQTMISEEAIASGAGALTPQQVSDLQALRSERLELLAETEPRHRLARTDYRQASLADLQQASRRSGIPIILYWAGPTDVIVWVVTPTASDVQAVFLPQFVLNQLIDRVRVTSIERIEGRPYDAAAAKLLYRYLIAPFAAALAAPQVLIIPQGELTDLPFEALINPEDNRFLVEQTALSYAPNATLAVAMLAKPGRVDLSVQAVADRTITTPEIANIASVANVRGRDGGKLNPLDAGGMTLARFSAAADGASVLHVLAHGKTGMADPLLSEMRLGETLYAADFLAVPLSRTRLVVLSACESGVASRRISNELYGFPWALTVAGADMIVVSRWRADSMANAQWMQRFYSALADGASPALAAAEAHRDAIANGRSHPNLWAAMQVTGR